MGASLNTTILISSSQMLTLIYPPYRHNQHFLPHFSSISITNHITISTAYLSGSWAWFFHVLSPQILCAQMFKKLKAWYFFDLMEYEFIILTIRTRLSMPSKLMYHKKLFSSIIVIICRLKNQWNMKTLDTLFSKIFFTSLSSNFFWFLSQISDCCSILVSKQQISEINNNPAARF